jgi:hypothetical protein
MFFLTKLSENAPLQWVDLSFTPEGQLNSIKLDNSTEIPLERWPLLIFDFHTDRYFCLQKLPVKDSPEFMLVRYKLSITEDGEKRFIQGETVQVKDNQYDWKPSLKNQAPQYVFKRTLANKESQLFSLHDDFVQTLSPSQKETFAQEFEQLSRKPIETIDSIPSTELSDELSIENILSLSVSLENALQFQEEPLALLAYLSESVEPIHFCVTIVTLLKKGISPEILLNTGILGNFYKQHASDPTEIQKTYQALQLVEQSTPGTIPGLSTTLLLVQQSRIQHNPEIERNGEVEYEVMKHIALDASEAPREILLKEVPHSIIFLPLNITPSLENIQALYEFFKESFVLLLITNADNWLELQPLLSFYLKTFTLEQNITLAKSILPNSISTDDNDKLFSVLSSEIVDALLNDSAPSWSFEVLRYVPHSQNTLSPERLHNLFSSVNVTKNNFKTLFLLSIWPFLSNYKITLQETLANFLLDQTETDRDILFDSEVEEIVEHNLALWAKQQYEKYYQLLNDILASGPLIETFDELQKSFQENHLKIVFLHTIFDLALDYPNSKVVFQAWVLERASEMPDFVLEDVLNIIFQRFDEDYSRDTVAQIIARLELVATCSETLQHEYIDSINESTISSIKTDFPRVARRYQGRTSNNIFSRFILKITDALLKNPDPNWIFEVLSYGPNTQDHFRALVLLSTQPFLSHYKVSLQEALADFLLAQSEADRNTFYNLEVKNAFGNNLASWAQRQDEKYCQLLSDSLESGTLSDILDNLHRVFQENLPNILFLKKVSPSFSSRYSNAKHTSQAWVLTKTSEKPDFILKDALQLFGEDCSKDAWTRIIEHLEIFSLCPETLQEQYFDNLDENSISSNEINLSHIVQYFLTLKENASRNIFSRFILKILTIFLKNPDCFPNIKDNFRTLASLSTHSSFSSHYKVSLQEALADFLLAQSETEQNILFDSEIKNAFGNNLSSWAKRQDEKYCQLLSNSLESGPLSDVLDNLQRVFQESLPDIQFLKKISPSLSSRYPHSQHTFQTWVLEKTSEKPDFILNNVLNVIFQRFDKENTRDDIIQMIERLEILSLCPETLQEQYLDSLDENSLSLIKINFSHIAQHFLLRKEPSINIIYHLILRTLGILLKNADCVTNTKEIFTALVSLSTYSLFSSHHKVSLQEAFADFLLAQSETNRKILFDSAVNNTLKSNLVSWAHRQDEKYCQLLSNSLESGPLSDVLDNLQRVFQENLPDIQFLKKISPSLSSRYPHSQRTFQTWVLEKTSEKPDFILNNVLNIIFQRFDNDHSTDAMAQIIARLELIANCSETVQHQYMESINEDTISSIKTDLPHLAQYLTTPPKATTNIFFRFILKIFDVLLKNSKDNFRTLVSLSTHASFSSHYKVSLQEALADFLLTQSETEQNILFDSEIKNAFGNNLSSWAKRQDEKYCQLLSNSLESGPLSDVLDNLQRVFQENLPHIQLLKKVSPSLSSRYPHSQHTFQAWVLAKTSEKPDFVLDHVLNIIFQRFAEDNSSNAVDQIIARLKLIAGCSETLQHQYMESINEDTISSIQTDLRRLAFYHIPHQKTTIDIFFRFILKVFDVFLNSDCVPNTKNNFRTLMFLSMHGAFASYFSSHYKVLLQEALADFLLAQSETDRNILFDSEVNSLFSNNLSPWAQRQDEKYCQLLSNSLESGPLSDIFDNLQGVFQENLPKIQFLKKVSPSLSSRYPHSQHTFQAWVLTKTSEKPDFVLNHVLNIIFQRFDENYSNDVIARLEIFSFCPENLQEQYLDSLDENSISLIKINFSRIARYYTANAYGDSKNIFCLLQKLISQESLDSHINSIIQALNTTNEHDNRTGWHLLFPAQIVWVIQHLPKETITAQLIIETFNKSDKYNNTSWRLFSSDQITLLVSCLSQDVITAQLIIEGLDSGDTYYSKTVWHYLSDEQTLTIVPHLAKDATSAQLLIKNLNKYRRYNQVDIWHYFSVEQILTIAPHLAKDTTVAQLIIESLNAPGRYNENIWHSFSFEEILAIIPHLVKDEITAHAILQGLNTPRRYETIWHKFSYQEIASLVSLLSKDAQTAQAIIQIFNTLNKDHKIVWYSFSAEQIFSLVLDLSKDAATAKLLIESFSTPNTSNQTIWSSLSKDQIISLIPHLSKDTATAQLIFDLLNTLNKYDTTIWNSLSSKEIISLVTYLPQDKATAQRLIEILNTKDDLSSSDSQNHEVASVLASLSYRVSKDNSSSVQLNQRHTLFAKTNIKGLSHQHSNEIDDNTTIAMDELHRILFVYKSFAKTPSFFDTMNKDRVTAGVEPLKRLSQKEQTEITWGEVKAVIPRLINITISTPIKNGTEYVIDQLRLCFSEKQARQSNVLG